MNWVVRPRRATSFFRICWQNEQNSQHRVVTNFSQVIWTFTTVTMVWNSLASTAQSIPENNFQLNISGEALFGTAGYGGGTENKALNQPIIDQRLRINLETKFSAADKLKIRLETGNSTPLNSKITGTNMTRLGYDGAKNNVNISLIQYQFPISDRTQGIVEITGSGYSDNLDNFSPLANSATGAMSRFGRYQPIYRLSNEGSGLTIKHRFSDEWSASASYTVPSLIAASPSGGGFGSGANAIIGQIKYAPSPDLKLGVTYARSYHPNGSGVTGATGSLTANTPFPGDPTTAQHYGVSATYQAGRDVTIAGWGGLTVAQSSNFSNQNGTSINYALSATAQNFGAPGNTLGLIVGVPPQSNQDSDTSLHLEAIYKIKVNDNVDITPGVLVITNPEHNHKNPSIWVGSVRTTFRF